MSVGHLARILEAGGISTVVVAVNAFLPMMAPMKIPRLLLTHHPMGRPLGMPGDAVRQCEVIVQALSLLEKQSPNGLIIEMPGRYL
jgi:hypothetical protein